LRSDGPIITPRLNTLTIECSTVDEKQIRIVEAAYKRVHAALA